MITNYHRHPKLIKNCSCTYAALFVIIACDVYKWSKVRRRCNKCFYGQCKRRTLATALSLIPYREGKKAFPCQELSICKHHCSLWDACTKEQQVNAFCATFEIKFNAIVWWPLTKPTIYCEHILFPPHFYALDPRGLRI